MQFDVVVGNPPFKNGESITVMKAALSRLKEGGEAAIVLPASWNNGKKREREFYDWLTGSFSISHIKHLSPILTKAQKVLGLVQPDTWNVSCDLVVLKKGGKQGLVKRVLIDGTEVEDELKWKMPRHSYSDAFGEGYTVLFTVDYRRKSPIIVPAGSVVVANGGTKAAYVAEDKPTTNPRDFVDAACGYVVREGSKELVDFIESGAYKALSDMHSGWLVKSACGSQIGTINRQWIESGEWRKYVTQ